MKKVKSQKSANGKFIIEKTEVLEYEEPDLVVQLKRLKNALKECVRQRAKLDDWEQELQNEIKEIEQLLKGRNIGIS